MKKYLIFSSILVCTLVTNNLLRAQSEINIQFCDKMNKGIPVKELKVIYKNDTLTIPEVSPGVYSNPWEYYKLKADSSLKNIHLLIESSRYIYDLLLPKAFFEYSRNKICISGKNIEGQFQFSFLLGNISQIGFCARKKK